SFTKAVEDLDRAAARAEQGLADLRAATDEAAESLAGRIERAGALAARLEKLTSDAVSDEQKLTGRAAAAPPPRAPAPPAAAPPRFAGRYGGDAWKPAAEPAARPRAFADAAARNDLILEDEVEPAPEPMPIRRVSSLAQTPELNERLERLRALARGRGEAV